VTFRDREVDTELDEWLALPLALPEYDAVTL
jgi:hypothetical protein